MWLECCFVGFVLRGWQERFILLKPHIQKFTYKKNKKYPHFTKIEHKQLNTYLLSGRELTWKHFLKIDWEILRFAMYHHQNVYVMFQQNTFISKYGNFVMASTIDGQLQSYVDLQNYALAQTMWNVFLM